MVNDIKDSIGRIIRQSRVSMHLTLLELSKSSGVSLSHLARIERGERLPSAHVLRNIARPLGFSENELFMLAGFLSKPSDDKSKIADYQHYVKRVDPLVARILARETVEMQRTLIGILSLFKIIARKEKKTKSDLPPAKSSHSAPEN